MSDGILSRLLLRRVVVRPRREAGAADGAFGPRSRGSQEAGAGRPHAPCEGGPANASLAGALAVLVKDGKVAYDEGLTRAPDRAAFSARYAELTGRG